jgi:hypothetical protein
MTDDDDDDDDDDDAAAMSACIGEGRGRERRVFVCI